MLGGGIETKPERDLGNPGVLFPHGKQKQAVCHGGSMNLYQPLPTHNTNKKHHNKCYA